MASSNLGFAADVGLRDANWFRSIQLAYFGAQRAVPRNLV